MYKCSLCDYQSQPGESQFKNITFKVKLEKGWNIGGEIVVCKKCHKVEK